MVYWLEGLYSGNSPRASMRCFASFIAQVWMLESAGLCPSYFVSGLYMNTSAVAAIPPNMPT